MSACGSVYYSDCKNLLCLPFMYRKHLLFLFFCLSSLLGFGQSHYLQARLDGVLNVPQVEVLQNTGGYQIRSGGPLVGTKIGYLYLNQRDMGFSVGLQRTRKQYMIYEERRQSTALMQSFTTPRYYTLSVPLAFEYRGKPLINREKKHNSKRFLSLSAGVAVAYTKETSITIRSRGAGKNFQSSLSHSDDFSFAAVWGYEVFLNPAYNFQLQNGSYVGLGVGFTLSPARYASLSIKQERDGGQYEGSFQPKALSYLSISVGYHYPIWTGKRNRLD